MAQNMKAWHFTGTGEPLKAVEIPVPEIKPNEVLLHVKAADPGWRSTLAKVPIVMGHEEVIKVGSAVTSMKVGDRCGICPTTPSLQCPGFAKDGGFAEYIAALPEDLVPIPEGVSFALGTDAGMTSYHAVNAVGKVKKGETVGIIGFGGLGQIGTRVAVLLGADVYVAEVNEKVWPNVLESGAKKVVKNLKEIPEIKFDCIIDYAGFGTTTAEAVDIIKLGGRVVVVGMGKLESTISTKSLILNQTSILGSNGGTWDDIAGVYKMFATGLLKPSVSEIKFEEIPDGLHRLHDGKVVGRLVATRP